MLTRRVALGLFATTAALAGSGFTAWQRPAGAGPDVVPAAADAALSSALMQPGALPDIWLGPETAKVTVIEYASLTCTHCADFHAKTWPELKKRYVDTGLIRFVLREFPLDPLSAAAFMLARSDGGARYYPLTDLLFDTQASWAFVPNPKEALLQTVRQAGFSQEKFEQVLRDQKLYDAVNAVKNRAADTLKVDSTPTFFINGEKKPGAIPLAEFEAILKPMLGA